MSVDLYTTAYRKSIGNHPYGDDTCRDYDSGGNEHGNQGKYVHVHTKGRSGDRRHWHSNTKVDANGKVESNNDCIRWTAPPSDEGHNPCKDLGESTLLLQGLDDFDASADFGLKCTVPNSKLESVIARGTTESLMGPTAINRDNARVSFLQQILFGGYTKTGKQMGGGRGFCGDAENLEKVVMDGKTCLDLVEEHVSEMQVKTMQNDYCKIEENKTQERCACLNVMGRNFIENCKENPHWKGCEQVNRKREEVEAVLCPMAETDANGNAISCPANNAYSGNADCLAPNICTGSDIYGAKEPPPACAMEMNVCNQLMMVDDIQSIGGLEITQTCNIDVDSLLRDKIALDAAIEAAKEQDQLWRENEYQLQQYRKQKLIDDAAEMERIRLEMADAQALDRDAERDLAAQMIAHRSANSEKRMAERMAFEQSMAEMEAAKIGGKDPQTLAFYAAVVFCAVFMLIFAMKI